MKLSQIVVNEVSLVDKAANRRKFLLYKRDSSGDQPTLSDVLKGAESAIELLVGRVVSHDDKVGEGERQEFDNYAQQAKDLLSGKMLKMIGHFTKEEREALVKAITPPPKETPPPPVQDNEELTEEELAVARQIGLAVTSLQQELASLKG